MDDYYSDNQPELIHCKFCGEDYAATYKACPFCHTAPNGKKVGGARSGRSSRAGNRVRTNTRGGGYGGARSPLSIVGIILSIILIVAAVVIVAVLVKTTLFDKPESQANTSSQISTSQQADTSGTGSQQADQSAESTEPQIVAPDSVTLDQTSLTLSAGGTANLTATIEPSGWVGQTIWTTSDSNIATVDASGVVTYVGAGTCTITASAGGVTATCEVTCNGADTTSEPTGDGGDTAGSSIEVTAYGNAQDGDFTLNMGEPVPFKATGGDGTNYAWSIEDPSIASVDPTTGECTGLAEGKTTMTVTSGGETATVTIRVKP